MRRTITALLVLLLTVALAAPAVAAPDATPRIAYAAPAGIPDAWPGLLEVELVGGDGAALEPAVAVVAAAAGVREALPAFPGVGDPELSRWLTVAVTPGAEAAVAAALARLPQVATAAPVPVRVPAYDPNDPRRAEQWHLDRIGARNGWGVARGTRAVRVGVIDTQFDTRHPELSGVLFRRDGKPGVDALEAGCRPATPYSEHGTFVAGIAAAGTDNRTGVSSVGFSIGVVAVQAGFEHDGMCLISSRWSQALVGLADAGVRVVNLSFAGTRASGSEKAAVRYAADRGTVVVAAAGNHGSTTPEYPAALPLVLGVAATDKNDRLWASSNRGSWVDVAAPGASLLTICPGGGYCSVSGTSAAAPVVAGIATLLSANQPGLTGLQLRARVLDAAAEITGASFDPAIGYGRVRLDRTLLQRSVRLYGPDRIATAQAVGREAHPGGRAGAVTRVVLVPADAPGDQGWTVTLPAAGLLAAKGTAIVMTSRERLHPRAADELDRLLGGRGRVILPGSAAVGVSTAVERQLRDAGYDVQRLNGADAAGTAAAIGDEVVRTSRATAALVSRGDTFADALSLAGPAAAHGYPLVFVGSDTVPAATCAWVRNQGSIRTLHLAGGTQAISPAVERQLRDCTKGLLGVGRDLTVTRDAGASRVETSVAIARRHFGSQAPAKVAIANGFSWPDAVTGGVLSATTGAPVLLTTGRGDLEPAVRSYVAGKGRQAYVLGGPVVVSDVTRASLEAATR